MKANRKFITEEEAVSPVIAVILMVAITVVLAATVFVLVNDLGKNVGSTGPNLGLVSDSAQSSTSKWAIKVSSATKLADLSDYRFVFTTPSHGTFVSAPAPSGGAFTTPYVMNGTWATANGAPSRLDASAATTVAALADAHAGYWLEWTDVDGNAKWSVGDKLVITYGALDVDDNGFDDPFAQGEYQLEILHTPTGSSTASLPRSF